MTKEIFQAAKYSKGAKAVFQKVATCPPPVPTALTECFIRDIKRNYEVTLIKVRSKILWTKSHYLERASALDFKDSATP